MSLYASTRRLVQHMLSLSGYRIERIDQSIWHRQGQLQELILENQLRRAGSDFFFVGGVPVFGICLGHQMLALALGATTRKMEQGHHGANHPVKDLTTGKVEIVSMNHGFTVDRESLPAAVKETHVSLFDGTNAGLAVEGQPIFSVQHHPEASPGPKDSLYLFERFADMMDKAKGG